MGTHISRVKSVDLDAWTDEQLQSILKWGNARANKYWEAKLQTGHVPSEAKIENFIRTKYESKRWVMDGPMPDPSTLGDDDDVPLNVVQEKAKIERSASQIQPQAPTRTTLPAPVQAPPPQSNIDLFGDFDPPPRPSTTDIPSSRPIQSAAPPVPKSSKPQDSLMGLDFFGAPQPAGVGRPSSAASNPVTTTNPRGDLKNSILSLYASAPKSQPAPQPTHGRQTSFGAMGSPTAPKQDAFGGLADAFGGMNFSTASAAQPPPPVQSAASAFGFSSGAAAMSPQPQSSQLTGLSFLTTVPTKATASTAQISSPPPLGGGDFFSSTATKPPAPKPGPVPSASNVLSFSFAQKSSSPPVSKPAAVPVPADLFGDDGFSSFASASSAPAPTAAKVPSLPMQSPPAVSSPFNLSSPTTTTSKAAPAGQPLQATMTSQPSSSLFDPWGASDTNAWGAPESAKPIAPKVELGNVPSKITPNDMSGGWGAPTSSPHKPSTQPTVAADEDFGGWTSAATPAASKPSGGFGASDPFDNPWG